MPKKTKKKPTKITALKHKRDKRPNIPSAEMSSLVPEEVRKPEPVNYLRKHDLDLQLLWRGKQNDEYNNDLTVDAVPIYVHEKIKPQVIIEELKRQTAMQKQQQPGQTERLFDDFNGLPDEARVEFYQHQQNWSNRMILGDSLRVMASLAHKEGLRGQVQCIFFDPPYGINFSSNWQIETGSTSVTDKDQSREPEMIQAFRDTWKDGIHSYLSYLRDRLTVARDLLTESGSIFVQIGDDNVHRVALLMDEAFGALNRMSTITFATSGGSSSTTLPNVADYLLWYAKDREQVKFRQLYEQLDKKGIIEFFGWGAAIEKADGSIRKVTLEDRLAPHKHIKGGETIFRRWPLNSQGRSTTGRSDPYIWRGRSFECGERAHWPVSKAGMDRMGKAGRFSAESNHATLTWKRYEDEIPGRRIHNLWSAQQQPPIKHYVVQSSPETVKRCILMTTDPGDLVLDPTCGSGTTATVAEQWGRRWITMDTSRVALAIARARLMGNQYPYYLLNDSEEGAAKEAELSGRPVVPNKQFFGDIRQGLIYERVGAVTPKLIADNNEIDIIWERYREEIETLLDALNNAIGEEYREWQVPTKTRDSWNSDVQNIHRDFVQKLSQRQKEMRTSIRKNSETIFLVDQPYIEKNAVRVTGPFTVESLSLDQVLPVDDRMELTPDYAEATAIRDQEKTATRNLNEQAVFLEHVLELLKLSGVQNTRKNERLIFEEIEPWPQSRRTQFIGRYRENGRSKRAAVCVGPEYGTVTRSLLIDAAREAADYFDLLIVIGFAFEGYADEDLINIGGFPVLKVRAHHDLHMADNLKANKNSNLFVTVGEPDIVLTPLKDDMFEVKILGIDIFDPTTGGVRSNNVEDIACWMCNTPIFRTIYK